jgi:hypothetical protein
VKRADCLIFYFPPKGRTYALVIEVTKKNYHLNEIREKLQNVADFLEAVLGIAKGRVTLVPMLYAQSHIPHVARYLQYYRVRYCGMQLLICIQNYGEDAFRLVRG